jgi:hypothetical protein
MTSYDTDQARELRRARLVAIRPTNAPAILPRADYNKTYRDQHIVTRDSMLDAEESEHVMFCPACQEHVGDTQVAVRKLHVTYEEDPLRNYRALVTARCDGCGWNEIIPVERPPALEAEELQATRDAEAYRIRDQHDQMRNMAGIEQRMLMPSLWANEAQRQMSKQLALGAAYGMGPQKIMKMGIGLDLQDAGLNRIGTDTKASKPLKGQALADSIWQDYDALDKMHAEAAAAKLYLENRRIHEQYVKAAADQMAKAIDDDVMETLKKWPQGVVKVAPPPSPKYAPPPPLDHHDKAEMARMIDEAYRKSNGDRSKFEALADQIRNFFR